jgi:hypothetical protein
MNFHRRGVLWPMVFASVFFLVCVVVFVAYPFGFWSSTDNEAVGLGSAVNIAYRLADFRIYPDESMAGHPGVLSSYLNWLALALAGYPFPRAGQDFFRAVIDHVGDYQRTSVGVGAFAGATGVYIFARTALKLIPPGATAAGLAIWMVSTPATILFFMSPGIESVAILTNALFLAVLVRLAFERDIDSTVVFLAACVGAFAYLNKLSYIYIPLAFVSAVVCKSVFRRIGWSNGLSHVALFIFTFVAVIVAVGDLIIGWSTFRKLLHFHLSVIHGSGLYGAGDQAIVSEEGIWHAITSIWAEATYAVPLAMIAGAALCVAGLITGLKNPQKDGVAVVAIGVGVAALLSALIVVKHYALHYTAGVSAALPACVVAGYLFAQAWGYRFRSAPAVAATCAAILLMAYPVLTSVRFILASRANSTRLAVEDMKDITALTSGMTRVIDFAYKTQFSQFGEGVVIGCAGVPRLTQQYLESKRGVTNSIIEHLVTEDVGAYVIDKNYFLDAEAVKKAPNLDLLGPRPVRYRADDRLIELRTVFLLMDK